jgi:hypothetical protein
MLDRKLSHGVVIEEEERLSALDDEIVDAHRDQIDANGVVTAAGDGDLQLRADAVGSSDQDRVLEPRFFEIKQSPEPADVIDDAGASRRPCERLDRIDQPFTGIDIDTRILVAESGDGCPLNGMLQVPRWAARAKNNAWERFGNHL